VKKDYIYQMRQKLIILGIVGLCIELCMTIISVHAAASTWNGASVTDATWSRGILKIAFHKKTLLDQGFILTPRCPSPSFFYAPLMHKNGLKLKLHIVVEYFKLPPFKRAIP
jgi:hypothetical protein